MSDLSPDELFSCLALSKTPAGRQKLIASGDLDSLCGKAAHLLTAWEMRSSQCSADTCEPHNMLVLLRVLRNSCAAGSSAAHIMQQHSLHQAVSQLAANIAARQPGLQQEQPATSSYATQGALQDNQQQPAQQDPLLLTAMQLLANLSVADQQHPIVWKEIFPRKLQSILSSQQVSVHEAAALAILNCLRSSSQVLEDLTSAAAHTIWLQLLTPLIATAMTHPSTANSSSTTPAAPTAADSLPAQGSTAGNDNLCLLVKAVVLQHGRLQELLSCLQLDTEEGSSSNVATTISSSSSSNDSESAMWGRFRPNEAHAVLLHVVASEVSALPAAKEEGDHPAQGEQRPLIQDHLCLPWLQHLVGLLRHLWSVVTAAASSSSSSSSGAERTTVAAYVLEATLQVLQAAVSREDAGASLVTFASSSSDSNKLAAAAAGAGAVSAACDCILQPYTLGLVSLLLDMLKRLGPPPRRQQQHQSSEPQGDRQPQQPPHTAPTGPLVQPQQQQQQQPYVGYRADLVALLSNFLHGHRHIQDYVLSAGGIEVLLNNCNLDDTAPMAREWAIWSIRNMCQGNEEVQKYISQFQAVEAVHSRELDRMGKELHLDMMTHQLKLVDKQSQQ